MTSPLVTRPMLILPVGTQVVSRIEIRDSKGNVLCPEGAVGVVAKAPADGTHSYIVRLPDGSEIPLRRHNLTIRKHQQREDLEAIGVEEDELFERVIYRCVVGSRAYGLEQESSDVDRRGFYLPPADLREPLLSIKRNEVPWKEVEAWRLELHERFDAALAASRLPDRPDYRWANDFLIRARRMMVGSTVV